MVGVREVFHPLNYLRSRKSVTLGVVGILYTESRQYLSHLSHEGRTLEVDSPRQSVAVVGPSTWYLV